MPIDGVWYNELNSTVQLKTDGQGNITGTYESAVGSADGKYQLSGRYDTAPQSNGTALGFVVTWQNETSNAHSSTSWSGQYQDDSQTGEQIYTMWLLSTATKEQDDWGSVQVGEDRFTRTPSNAQTVAARRARGNFSNPND